MITFVQLEFSTAVSERERICNNCKFFFFMQAGDIIKEKK